MASLDLGVHEFKPEDFLKLVQQHDDFTIVCGSKSYLQIHVPTKWVQLGKTTRGTDYLTCRNKRKRDGHLFKIYGSKFVFEITDTAHGLSGVLKTDRSDDEFVVSMWKAEGFVFDSDDE